jgi:hypothetical protein
MDVAPCDESRRLPGTKLMEVQRRDLFQGPISLGGGVIFLAFSGEWKTTFRREHRTLRIS